MTQGNDGLRVKIDSFGQSHVEGVLEIVVESFLEFLMMIEKGETNKVIKTTQYNMTSSRSHTILEIILKQKSKKPTYLTLCDLAGSERFSDEKLKDKLLQTESRNINKSLSTLTRYDLLTKGDQVSVQDVEGSRYQYFDSLSRLKVDQSAPEQFQL